MEKYSIWSGHMESLKKKITTIQNKCKKFGCNFHFAEIGEELKEIQDLDGNIVTCRFIIVEVEGRFVINGWEFVARVEHTEAGNIFSKGIFNVEIPDRYRTTYPICEHCNSMRMRKDTFIVRNIETGEFKQVGKSCLKDFTGGLSATAATWLTSIKDVFEEVEMVPISCGRRERYFDTEEVLQYIAETIRHFGYSKTENVGNSTKDRMERFFEVSHGMIRHIPEEIVEETRCLMKKVGFNHNSNEAIEMVNNAVEWIQEQENTNDYLHNLKTAALLKYTTYSRFGLLVSLFPAYDRQLEIETKRKQEMEQGKCSEHVGKIGDRIQIEVESVKCITSWGSSYNGCRHITTYVWKITGKDGNIFTWKTSTYLNEDIPPKLIKGSVKEHKIFRDIRQTELTRCRVI